MSAGGIHVPTIEETMLQPQGCILSKTLHRIMAARTASITLFQEQSNSNYVAILIPLLLHCLRGAM
jgi:hypothetical protein